MEYIDKGTVQEALNRLTKLEATFEEAVRKRGPASKYGSAVYLAGRRMSFEKVSEMLIALKEEAI